MAICAPVNPCPCQNWSIAPGDTWPLTIDWSSYFASMPGFSLNTVASVELLDLNVNPPVPVDPDDEDAPIRIVSGMTPDPDPPPQPGFAKLLVSEDYAAIQFLIEASDDAPIGSAYRLNVKVIGRDCDGRKIPVGDCVFITISMV